MNNNNSPKVIDRDYWRSLEQLSNTPDFQERLHREFPEGASEFLDPISRRTFLTLMGASITLAGITGCRKPVEEIIPYVSTPENVVLGRPLQYATTMNIGTNSLGLLVTSREGRPIKIEGNDQHPSSLGGTNAFAQAEILNLYDPDRSNSIRSNKLPQSWEDFADYWRNHYPQLLHNKVKGFAILSESSSSPTLSRIKRQFHKIFPEARWVTWEAISNENEWKGLQKLTGKRLTVRRFYDRAKVILSLDADFLHLENDNINAARGFADGRRVASPNDEMNRLYAAESALTLTGAMSDHRLRLQKRSIPLLAQKIASELVKNGISLSIDVELSGNSNVNIPEKWISAVAVDLIKHRGECLIVAGRGQPSEVHALAAALNDALGNTDKTVSYHPAEYALFSDSGELSDLVQDMNSGFIETLVILGANPVYNAPVDLGFAEAMKKVDNSISLSQYYDETAHLCNWHVPQSHFLESWGDNAWIDGSLNLIQPLIQPLHGGRSAIEMANFIITGSYASGYELVQDTWRENITKSKLIPDFNNVWRKALHDGIWKDSALNPINLRNSFLISSLTINSSSVEGMELAFSPDGSMFDGRYANNGWMQELPDAITKLMWDNAALISPRTAEKMDLNNADMIKLSFQGRSMEMPIWIMPGHVDDSITLTLGYGRYELGRVARNAGFNAYALRTANAQYFGGDLSISKTGRTYVLSCSQDHSAMEGRPLVREATLEEYRNDPDFAAKAVAVPPLQSLWQEHKYDEGYQWGMAIDLNTCIGCNACTVACQSENNIPIVGKKEAGYGREMHWIRLDRYFEGDLDNPHMVTQPVGCQHCEMAPCEQVCPVAATMHDSEGLNVMVYNRCVGTRYCSNNCPYKVRRFNFFNYTGNLHDLIKMAQNPDVTVRSRGVMEKCTYCVQRINRAKHEAKLSDRPVQDGEIITACEAACPTQAIVFGDTLDPESRVSKLKAQNRNYQMLAEFNTRPRTSYLAKLRNPNPDLG